MAFSFKNIFLVLMVLLCLLVLLLASGCIAGHGSSYGDIAASGVQSRRELRVIEKKKQVVAGEKMGMGVEWELRKAPSGPDPIHHNAARPKNPTTTTPPHVTSSFNSSL